jgi:hypothetical protein
MFTSFMSNPRIMNNPLRDWWLKSMTESIRKMTDKQEEERKRFDRLCTTMCVVPSNPGGPGGPDNKIAWGLGFLSVSTLLYYFYKRHYK